MTTLTLFLALVAVGHQPSAISHRVPARASVSAEDPDQNTPGDSL